METVDKNKDIKEEDVRRITEWTEILRLSREIDLEAGWKRLEKRIRFNRLQGNFFLFVRNAAAVLLIPLMATTLYLYMHRTPVTESNVVAQIETRCGYGQTTIITLPDGSEVWLNAGSALTYPQRFTDNHRTVRLTGEAYFKVQADPKHRFDVKLPNGLTASAYGTEFNITAYENARNMDVTLVKGNMEVADADKKQTQILNPEQHAVYSCAEKILKTSDADIYVKTSWKEGKLVFRKANMEEVINRLSLRYNTDIEVKDRALFKHEYSATFTTESIEDVMRLLSKLTPIDYKFYESKRKDDLTFSKRRLVLQRKQ